jgi:heat-inducible transcriptional repressor
MDKSELKTLLIKAIVEEYIKTNQPVSSKILTKKYFKNLSSATLRNKMAELEKTGMLEKMHTSSGRVPSLACYKIYEEKILKSKVDENIKNRLTKIFSMRNVSIDTIIDQATLIINDCMHLPSIVTTLTSNDLLKRFDLVKMNENAALILLITSSGLVSQNVLPINNSKQMEDISTCIRIFNDRLVDTPLKDVSKKMELIKEIVRNSVYEYEGTIQKIVEKIININYQITPKTEVRGSS